LGHGDLVGRLESAALHLDDPRVSEAHAMVSLRGATLTLLALRGRLAVAQRPVATLELAPGLEIELARGLTLTVEAVSLPARVTALRVAGMDVRVLTGVCSLFGPPKTELRPGFHADALAHVWARGDALLLRREGAPDAVLAPGDRADVGGVELAVVELSLAADGQYVTTARGAVAAPLEIIARYESAHIYRDREPALVLTGISARILSELVACGVPTPWSAIAAELWPDEPPDEARAKWDVNLGRLRKKLERARIRGDLVASDGRGNVELRLERDDVVRDES
ncbi:MAG: hypothetical protein KC635_19775, partial [Myxococcales bacterium]|nr:hypothetical protein [Myxococcales bacterium]